ncbi:NADH:flavin oxidoreductase/NADH oxidase family protein [Paraneptunicella aestuarii]|uniref:NADH:flavin oxidoreductase/NADH oxidase family protein n=1 Tax=Paraneptunicella aestuarii TaxID=2831148 RepID=UPI001E4414C7|nr:NADH:flavin oxidoreductase/NADH oxidase family protein [Paraneptunicella aestuarii]UAA38508.1 NADH:flavin oxidoreductase/NADH oxidase family protein [Paraneptunicella aestuarii]
MPHSAFVPFELPCGLTLKNRLVKAAMEENMASAEQLPSDELIHLYRTWSDGGVGLIITGNVMIDHLAMTGPGGVVLEQGTNLEHFKRLATAAKRNNTKVWMQINHPGRQVFKRMGGKVLSPSDVALNMGKHSKLFGQPIPMTEEQIEDVIRRFATTAQLAEKAGFDGVEIHAAHGYLLAQFLSPLVNHRDDQWGGSLENRARLLLQVIQSIRAVVSPTFAVAVKLNSADFQRGGFDIDDAEQVAAMMSGLGVDVVELSGGSYEAPAMQGRSADSRTLAREAYFLEFAQRIAKSTDIPVMTTGGISRLKTVEQVLHSDIALVGMASALAFTPDLPAKWQQEPAMKGIIPRVSWRDKTLSGLAVMAMIKRNLRLLGSGQPPLKHPSPIWSLLLDQIRTSKLTKRYRTRYSEEVD